MRASAVFALALPVLAAAAPNFAVESRQTGDCNTGSIQCCASTMTSTTTSLGTLSGLLGLLLPSLGGLIGLNCSPLDILGIGGTNCNQQPVCCTDNSFSGLISLGCIPINISL
ncbi:fungal hydrophobin [Pholiota conissans]|uniref:Hydrophobin n=1 Tax=Pholiota conissans TaxID=109636 RepID=A0A9P6CSE5_9AGAR|nr:fungal hydrophobin [Pholiota conissans]